MKLIGIPGNRKANGTDCLVFFGYLQQEKPHLLAFKASGDKWPIVHAWLLRARRVTD